MTAEYYPLRALLLTISGWDRVLKEQLKGRKLA